MAQIPSSLFLAVGTLIAMGVLDWVLLLVVLATFTFAGAGIFLCDAVDPQRCGTPAERHRDDVAADDGGRAVPAHRQGVPRRTPGWRPRWATASRTRARPPYRSRG
ncbi:hypothetical protein LV779_02105 [Streptomyces thinghirensis]|nr:hypothetical protein [Streptomyces thinghirensis]